MFERTKSYGAEHFEIFERLFFYLKDYDIQEIVRTTEIVVAHQHVLLASKEFEENHNLHSFKSENLPSLDNETKPNSRKKLSNRQITSISKSCSSEFADQIDYHIPEFSENYFKYFSHIGFAIDNSFGILEVRNRAEDINVFTEANCLRDSLLRRKGVDGNHELKNSELMNGRDRISECFREMINDKTFSKFLHLAGKEKFSALLYCVARFWLYALLAERPFDEDASSFKWLYQWKSCVSREYRRRVKAQLIHLESLD
jgi:hypothetical protein